MASVINPRLKKIGGDNLRSCAKLGPNEDYSDSNVRFSEMRDCTRLETGLLAKGRHVDFSIDVVTQEKSRVCLRDKALREVENLSEKMEIDTNPESNLDKRGITHCFCQRVETGNNILDHELSSKIVEGEMFTGLPYFITRGLGVKEYSKICSSLKSDLKVCQPHCSVSNFGHAREQNDLDLELCYRPLQTTIAPRQNLETRHIRLPSPSVASLVLVLLLATFTFCPRGSTAQSVNLLGVNASSPYSTSVQQAPPTRTQPRPLQYIDELHLGVLMPEDETQEINIKLVHPVLQIACDKVKSVGLLTTVKNITIEDRDSKSSDVDGPLAAMALVKQGLVNAFFGPIVPNALSATALYCRDWNLPIFTSKGENTAFGQKHTEYKTLIRMMGSYDKSSLAIENLLEYFKIKMAGMIYDTPGGNFLVSECYDILKPVFDSILRKTNKPQSEVYRGTFDDRLPITTHNFTELLLEAKLQCRSK
ncbi:guanylate cyclase [Elysia marginata]|uniref:Guanylate cyclase n=1 Tax=Elysia marginata TaxID=1093978 RepID=A0AAV4F9Y7_9GAST|nr:guanylate cyclase [Elysia marginata]